MLRDLNSIQPFSTAVEIETQVHEESERAEIPYTEYLKYTLKYQHTLTLPCSALPKLYMDVYGCILLYLTVTHSHLTGTITRHPELTIFVLLLQ